MLELHVVKLAKTIHGKAAKLALGSLERRDRKSFKRKRAVDRQAVEMRLSAERTMDYARELQQDALKNHGAKQRRIQAVRDAINN